MESVSKEGLRAKPSSSINSNCQFESSLSRQTAKNRLCTAVLVTRSRDKFVDDAWNWSTVCPSSFRSSLPPCFSPRRENLTDATFPLPRSTRGNRTRSTFLSKILEDGKKGLLFLREYGFSIRFLVWTRSMHRYRELSTGWIRDRKVNLNFWNYCAT